NVLGNLYSFGAMLSFTTAHAAVVALRIKDPDRERPYRMPGNVRIRGRQIPITAVIGGTGTLLRPGAPRAPARLPRARLPNRAGADLRRRCECADARQRGEADRQGRHRLRGLRAPRAAPALARRGARGRGGARGLAPRERADPGPPGWHQGAHRLDPRTQPRRRTGRRGSADRR